MAKDPSELSDRQFTRAQAQHQEGKSALAELKIRRTRIEERTAELRRDLNLVIRDSQQLVASILRLRGRRDSSEWRHMEASRLRVATVGSVFLQRDISGPDDAVDLGSALRQVSHDADSQFGRRSVGLRYNIRPVSVTVRRAQHLALIANELVVNAYEHAFAGRSFGAIEVGTRMVQPRRGAMWVLDNGVGCRALSLTDAGDGWTMPGISRPS